MPKFPELLQRKSGYRNLDIEPYSKDHACGIVLTRCNRLKDPFNVNGDTEITETGGKLVNYAHSLPQTHPQRDKAPLTPTSCLYN